MASATGSSGDVVTLNSGDTEIATYTAQADFGTVWFSTSEITSGESYDVYVNGTLVTTVTANTASASEMGGGGGMGGGRR